MSQETFGDIVIVVQSALKKRNTQFLCVIPVEKRVAVALWTISKDKSFQVIATGIEPTTTQPLNEHSTT